LVSQRQHRHPRVAPLVPWHFTLEVVNLHLRAEQRFERADDSWVGSLQVFLGRTQRSGSARTTSPSTYRQRRLLAAWHNPEVAHPRPAASQMLGSWRDRTCQRVLFPLRSPTAISTKTGRWISLLAMAVTTRSTYFLGTATALSRCRRSCTPKVNPPTGSPLSNYARMAMLIWPLPTVIRTQWKSSWATEMAHSSRARKLHSLKSHLSFSLPMSTMMAIRISWSG